MVANGLEGVPWMISGADHSADVARVLAYAATAGTSGVISPGDLKVVPSGTPNMQVHLGVGAFACVNKSGGVQSQSYVGRATAVSDLTVATTGSSARSDLVVVRVKDPQFAPWQGFSTDPANGPFAFPEIIPGVPANTVRAEQLGLAQSLYAVARIDVPPNTTTGITSGMIKELRQLVAPHYLPVNALQQGPVTPEDVMISNTPSWQNWPSNAIAVDVPAWATHADVEITVNFLINNDARMNTRIQLGTLQGPLVPFDANLTPRPDGDAVIMQQVTQASFDVTSIAGSTQTLRLNAIRIPTAGNIEIDANQQVKFRVEFFQRPL